MGVGVGEPLDEVRVSLMGLGVGVDVGFQCGCYRECEQKEPYNDIPIELILMCV